MRFPSVLAAVLCAASLAAVESLDPPPGEWAFKCSIANDIVTRPGVPGTAEGDIQIRFEGITLAAEHLAYELVAWPGARNAIPKTLDLTAGAADDARLAIDTRGATLPTIGFRGLLQPRTAKFQLLDADPARPAVARYRADLATLGAFDGALLDGGRWIPHQGWADRAELWFEAKVDAHGISDLHLTAVVLYGQDGGRRMELDRWKGPEAPPAGPWPKEGRAGHLDSQKLTIRIAADGSSTITGDLSTWGTVLPIKRP